MIRVQLEKFEGPLALLLHLIRKNEMDIYDIEIHKITAQYLEYIQVMKQLDLEVAGDFVAMAATLIHIKSKMLLPSYNENGEVVENEDPRRELVQRLLEYQQYQDAAKQLGKRPLLGRELWSRPVKEMSSAGEPEIILEDGGLFAMIAGYRRVLLAMKKKVHVVFKRTQSVASRVLELKYYLVPGRRFQMTELILAAEATKQKVVITFLSMLELGKLGFVSVFQNDVYGPIYIDVKKTVEGDLIQQMDDYGEKDDVTAEAAATALAAQAAADAAVAEVALDSELPLMAAVATPEPEIEEMATDEDLFAAEAALGLEAVSVDTELSEPSVLLEKIEALEVAGGEMAELSAPPPADEVRKSDEISMATNEVIGDGDTRSKLNVMDAIRDARDAASEFLEDEKEKLSEI